MTNIIIAFAIPALAGLILGFALAVASVVFKSEKNEKLEEIRNLLPGANCGGCGYAGCDSYAKAVYEGKASPSLCKACEPGTDEKIALIVGREVTKEGKRVAEVMCRGCTGISKPKYEYEGIKDCRAVEKLGGGTKLCPNGCIGLGSCTLVCKFDAISVKDGVASVDKTKCTGCGACSEVCPKKIIKLVPKTKAYFVACKSVDNGKITRSYCDVGCISCGLCEKNCPTGAITVTDHVASIDYEKCISCGLCAEKCPRHIILSESDTESED